MYKPAKRSPSSTPGQARFARVPGAPIERSSFDRSCGRKSTFMAGLLVPIWVDEALPGDTFNLRMSTFARLSTPLFPVLDNMYLDSFFFAVPNRILWNNWNRMMGEKENPDDSTDYLVPQVGLKDAGGYLVSSLQDHMGIPPKIEDIPFSALPFRAYNRIWNEFFRDENLQDRVLTPINDGPDDNTIYTMLRRGKRHDSVPSCLPFAQKGPDVALPLGTTAPVVGIGSPTFQGISESANRNLQEMTDSSVRVEGSAPASIQDLEWVTTALETDLSSATAATINTIREAFQLQKLYERDARGGTRYVESIKAHFGVTSPDFRLQRPEYLGGGSQQISFSPVAQTDTGTQFSEGLGSLGAFAHSASSNHGFVKTFTEHCTLIGMVCLRADLTYQSGLHRMWSRRTRFDFAYPVFAGLGEQAVLNQEIHVQGPAGGSDDTDVFGYQERYAEYRYKPSEITGHFRSTAGQTLDVWHLAQEFTSLPTLGDTFIQDNPPVDRILSVQGSQQVLFDAWFKTTVARPLPVYGVPGNMDRL